ncbi:MAG: hypothetical protein V1834_00235 [Candidatus Micrarchaeota archaeon]
MLNFAFHENKLYMLTEKTGVKGIRPPFTRKTTRISSVTAFKDLPLGKAKLKNTLRNHGYDPEKFHVQRVAGFQLENGERHVFDEITEQEMEAIFDLIAEHGVTKWRPSEMTPDELTSFWEAHGAKRG